MGTNETGTIYFVAYYDTRLAYRREEFRTWEEKDRRLDQLMQGECFAILEHGEDGVSENQCCEKCGGMLGGVDGSTCLSDRCWPETFASIQAGLEKEEARIVASIAATEAVLRRLQAVPIEAYEWM